RARIQQSWQCFRIPLWARAWACGRFCTHSIRGARSSRRGVRSSFRARWDRTLDSGLRGLPCAPFFTSMELGMEKPLPFTGAAVVVLFAPGGLLAPAEGIPVPFVARVRGSTPFRVVIGRVDPCRVLLVQHPCRASIERV